MAKGNMLQGQATGKVGDIVFMVRNGQQVARVYTSAGGRSGDQASIAVRRQRVRFGAASNQYLAYRNIVRGMYRTGKSTKQSDYNFFVRENVDLLPFLTKEENAAGVKCAMPGTFSRGTLGSLLFNLVYAANGEQSDTLQIQLPSLELADEVMWDDSVSSFKTLLKGVFPSARKVSFSMIFVDKTEVQVGQSSSWTHTFDRGDVVFDLFESDSAVPDKSTVREYFAEFAPARMTGLMPTDEGVPMATNNALVTLYGETEPQIALLSQCYMLVFATNDQVGDCYTSVLDTMTVPESDGGLSLYSTLRTADHRQVAEDSYGYATGVMRTNIQQA